MITKNNGFKFLDFLVVKEAKMLNIIVWLTSMQ